MPYYDYKCKHCDNVWEEKRTIDDRNIPLDAPCPFCETEGQVIQSISSAPRLCDPHRMGRIKPSADWRDFTDRLRKNNPGSDFTTW